MEFSLKAHRLLDLPGHPRSPGVLRSTSLVRSLVRTPSGGGFVARFTDSLSWRRNFREARNFFLPASSKTASDLLTINRSKRSLLLIDKRRMAMAETHGEVLQGTLDLIVLKTL